MKASTPPYVPFISKMMRLLLFKLLSEEHKGPRNGTEQNLFFCFYIHVEIKALINVVYMKKENYENKLI